MVSGVCCGDFVFSTGSAVNILTIGTVAAIGAVVVAIPATSLRACYRWIYDVVL